MLKPEPIQSSKMVQLVLLIFGLSLPLSPGQILTGAEAMIPSSREIRGTHLGSTGKETPLMMVEVPAGSVVMGMKLEDAVKLCDGQIGILNVLARSVPQHKVKVEGFYCDLYEVTNAQYKEYLDRTDQKPSAELMEIAWKNGETFPEGQDRYPIRNVTYRDAVAFARWCGKRLPTEEEWMRAAAGDDGRIYAWGNDWDRGKNCTNKRNSLSPVGSYENGRSPYGIYDMTASVWEWTSSNFDAYDRYKPPAIKIGRETHEATPGFNAQMKVIKGGHYLQGDLQNRLDIREATLPSTNFDSIGFRCVKDLEPGMTLFNYAASDLEGSCVAAGDCDPKSMYSVEITEYDDSESGLIQNFQYFLVCPVAKAMTTLAKIKKESPEKPQPVGILSTDISLEEPNLPPGSYVIAYRNNGFSEADKKADYAREEAKRKREEEERKKKEEEEKERIRKENEKKGIKEKAKSQAEIDAELEQKRLEEEAKRLEEEQKREEEEARAAKERLGLVSSAKNHIDFPRDKDLIVFMNTNDTIVGYLEVEAPTEGGDPVPMRVVHSADTGMTSVEMGLNVLPSKVAKIKFNVKLRENPF